MNLLHTNLGYSPLKVILKAFSWLLFLLAFNQLNAQKQNFEGYILDKNNNKITQQVEVYDLAGNLISVTSDGFFQISVQTPNTLYLFTEGFEIKKIGLIKSSPKKLNIQLEAFNTQLSEVQLNNRKKEIFNLTKLKDIEGTAIYAGKKSEVVLIENSMANLAANNARQIYNQVSGLNIFQNDDAGLQLNIGGRGLDPNRTSNFNTRQNGYDISADVLGYPESYYSPPAEALEQIQVVRGAASLQYGTQFGGLVNFVFKKPNKDRLIELITRNTIGSNQLYTNFTSLSGTNKKLGYYAFYNRKQGDGFRKNSAFEANNAFIHLDYQFNDNSKISAEVTYMKYLAQQAGGLTDRMFENNPYQSNRSRNWFEVNWFLYHLEWDYQWNENKKMSLNFFGLDASRAAVGFRTNRVNQIDLGTERDLIKGKFQNFGLEGRFINSYKLNDKKAVFLTGFKFYKAHNSGKQGPGSAGSDADFNFYYTDFPNYNSQSDYTFPNLNLSLFGEHIFYLKDHWTLTPGIRLEYIKTQSDGYYKKINTDAAGNVILNETLFEKDTNERAFVLLGIGNSYTFPNKTELYANLSQNFRSVTFSDISIVNPSFSIDPNITDENGYSFDIGLRSKSNLLAYDFNIFALAYNNRIGFVQKAANDGSVKSQRGNVGNAFLYGLESVIDFNLKSLFKLDNRFLLETFLNGAFIQSEYMQSKENGVQGNKVEFVPLVNLKTGLRFGFENWMGQIQYSYLSKQYTDATNAESGSISGVIGAIPAYGILDCSTSFSYKRYKLEAGINNVTNAAYFTRRATGYPGPGIIPSPPRNYYLTVEIKL